MTYSLGVIVIIIYWFSFKYEKQNISIALLLIMIAGLALRVYMSLDANLHPWDERYHALVAKNLLLHPLRPTLYEIPLMPYDFKNWGNNHIWLHKQPLTLWGIATSLWIFGINTFAVRIPSILLSTLGIFLTFKIGKYFYNQKIGFIAAFLYSIHGMIIEKSSGRAATEHVDIFFLVFIQVAIYFAVLFAEKKKMIYNVLCGVGIGLAILVKWLPALIVLPIWLSIQWVTKQFSYKEIFYNFLILIFTTICVFLPWQIFIMNEYPLEAAHEYLFNSMHVFEAVEGHDGTFSYHFDNMRIVFGELIYLPIIWFIYKTWKHFSFNRLALLIWIFIPYIFFSLVKTKMPGYILFTAPAIFIIVALFWQYLDIYKKLFSYPLGIKILMILLLALPVRYSLERVNYFRPWASNPLWNQEISLLKENIAGEKNVIFNSQNPIETMFHTNFVAYEIIPNQKTVSDIKAKGYEVYILNTTKDESKIQQLKGCIIVDFKNGELWKMTPRL